MIRVYETADFIKQLEEKISYYGEHYVDDKNYQQETASREMQHIQVSFQSHIDSIRCGTKRGAFLFFFVVRRVAGVGMFPNDFEAGFTYSRVARETVPSYRRLANETLVWTFLPWDSQACGLL